MSKVQNWTISLLAVVALAVGVLMVSGAVSSAQEGTATPTPAASATEDAANDSAAATPAPESTDDGTNDGTRENREGCDKDGNGIPDDEETATDTSTT